MKTACALVITVGAIAASGQQPSTGMGSTAATQPAPAASAAAAPKFDVISVKPDPGGAMMMGVRMTPDGFSAKNVPAHMLFVFGMRLNENQVVGEPDWMKSGRWDIDAKVAGEDLAALKALDFNQRQAMMVQALTDRFGLKYHVEKRDLPVYELVVAKGGPKLTESKPDDGSTAGGAAGNLAGGPKGPPDRPGADGPKGPPDAIRTNGPNGPPGGPGRRLMMGRGSLNAQDMSIESVINALSNQLGRTVIDKTGLTGHYDFTLAWDPDLNPNGGGGGGPRGPEGGPPPPGGGPGPGGGAGGPAQAIAPGGESAVGVSIFTAVQEQLGLKLVSTKGPVDVYVIDHIEKPVEN